MNVRVTITNDALITEMHRHGLTWITRDTVWDATISGFEAPETLVFISTDTCNTMARLQDLADAPNASVTHG